MTPKPVAPLENGVVDPGEVEALIFTAVGAAIAFLLVASLAFVVCQCTRSGKRQAAAANACQEGTANGKVYSSVRKDHLGKLFINVNVTILD